ncbi:MAG TPA: hypothetical protein VEQ87_17285 [Burkholderiales bacterium]|nr:hypothetical protein [Burkholderiales bacterium]
MSAAATAAGYLYASGRLRGRAQREQEQHGDQAAEKPALAQPSRPRIERPRKEVRVAALPEPERPRMAPDRPRRTPTIQYRTRRWRPSET